MATLSATNVTLLDWAKRLDPDGQVAAVAEILNETNEINQDIPWVEGNLPTGHRSTIRTGIPAPTWRKLYGGVQPTKSTTVQVTDNCGMLEAYAEVDMKLANLNGMAAAFMASETRPHIEGIAQELAETLFYGNEATEPEAFTGLAPRFNATTAQNADNLLRGGGSGSDNTSIWLVGWSPETVFGIFPKGSKAGLTVEDKGQVTVENVDGSNGRAEMYRMHFAQDCGLVVKDWRYVVRICNIDVSDLTKNAASGADLMDLMVQALELPPATNSVQWRWYCNRTIRSFLRRQMLNKSNVWLGMDEVAGKKVLTFGEVPVRRVDEIVNTEATVS